MGCKDDILSPFPAPAPYFWKNGEEQLAMLSALGRDFAPRKAWLTRW